MKQIIQTIGVLLIIVGCQEKPGKATNSKGNQVHTKYVQNIPDSLRTLHQKQLVKKIVKVSLDHVKVIKNQMVFDMSRKDFRQTGIPMKYYDLFKKNMRDNNKFIEENNIKNVDEMLEQYRRNIREKYQ